MPHIRNAFPEVNRCCENTVCTWAHEVCKRGYSLQNGHASSRTAPRNFTQFANGVTVCKPVYSLQTEYASPQTGIQFANRASQFADCFSQLVKRNPCSCTLSCSCGIAMSTFGRPSSNCTCLRCSRLCTGNATCLVLLSPWPTVSE